MLTVMLFLCIGHSSPTHPGAVPSTSTRRGSDPAVRTRPPVVSAGTGGGRYVDAHQRDQEASAKYGKYQELDVCDLIDPCDEGAAVDAAIKQWEQHQQTLTRPAGYYTGTSSNARPSSGQFTGSRGSTKVAGTSARTGYIPNSQEYVGNGPRKERASSAGRVRGVRG